VIILGARRMHLRFHFVLDNGARLHERRGFNFLVFTKAPDLRCRKLGHPGPYNLDRYDKVYSVPAPLHPEVINTLARG